MSVMIKIGAPDDINIKYYFYWKINDKIIKINYSWVLFSCLKSKHTWTKVVN
jgi:hypothetical protein